MNIKKILFISPPAITFRKTRDINPLPPMGLGYLASVIEGMGIEVKILDCLLEGWDKEEAIDGKLVRVGLSEREIESFIASYDPDLVGINCQFSRQYRIHHQLLAIIKRVRPGCVTVAGGAHVTVCPEEVLNDENCDYILSGEAEDSFRGLLLAVMENRRPSDIDGAGWKEGGKPLINSKTRWINDLDSIPFPAYDIMDIEKYFGLHTSHGLRHRKRFSPIVTSRGCPAKCSFCSAYKVWGSAYRFRTVDNIIKEMEMLKNEYGIEELMFEDDNVTANPGRAKELFSKMIAAKFNFIWDTPNGVGAWSLDEETIDLMKESGCVKLNFPVESGSQRVLDAIINKPVKLPRIRQLISHCKKIKLDYGIFIVIGMPGETVEDIWASFRFAAENGCYNPLISVATPYPGTKLFNICMENNFFVNDFKLDDLFIKSFMIKTPHWSDRDLKRILSQGLIYLRVEKLLNWI